MKPATPMFSRPAKPKWIDRPIAASAKPKVVGLRIWLSVLFRI